MQRMFSLDELEAVIKGFINYVNELVDKDRLLCHPILKNKVFCVPLSDIESMENAPRLPISMCFLGSNDGRNWGALDMEEMINNVRCGMDYFIADLGESVYLEIDISMLRELIDLMTKDMPIIFMDTLAWKEGNLGERTTITINEWKSALE